jgi:hypothetical protein
MALNIPSTSVRSKHLKTLPVGCVFKDPKSGYNYEVVQKRLNDGLIKAAVAYIGSEKEAIPLEDVPVKYLKIDNPQRTNEVQ